MIHTKKSFGKHIENGLIFLGDSIQNTRTRQKDHELDYLKAGFVKDEEKLRMLKRDLYEAARGRGDSGYIANLRSAIASISNQLEAERNYRNSLGYQLSGVINSVILLALLGAFFSFPATWTCNVFKSQSQACQVSRVIPTATFQFFSEPK